MSKSKQNVNQQNKESADVLRKIADKLEIWHDSGPGDTGNPQGWANLPQRGDEAARASLRLLYDNVDLLHNCKSAYGTGNTECEEAIFQFNGLVSGMRNNRVAPEKIVEYVACWGSILARPGFISELRRWADELEKGLPKYPITLKVAVEQFRVSRTTLMREIKAKALKSYRPDEHSKTAEHILDATKVAGKYRRRR
jgi:hypothetical protein